MTDTTSMTGAEFRRHAGTDAQKWAEAMDKEARTLWDETEGLWPRNREERLSYLARWLRDYADACVLGGGAAAAGTQQQPPSQ